MTTANRGKLAESKLKKHLESLSSKVDSAFFRIPDAHAGSRTATLCDFLFIRGGVLYLVECKSTLHEFRLAHGNVDAGQVARMRLWKGAGARALVMVYHEKLDRWRSYEVDYFLNREGGSWDLRDTEPTTIEEAFEKHAYSLK